MCSSALLHHLHHHPTIIHPLTETAGLTDSQLFRVLSLRQLDIFMNVSFSEICLAPYHTNAHAHAHTPPSIISFHILAIHLVDKKMCHVRSVKVGGGVKIKVLSCL